MNTWYEIKNIDRYDSPCVVLYKDRVEDNIDRAISRVKDVSVLRPHVKTNKIAEVCRLMMAKGITKFKCATIAEAEMLAMIEASDILMAYQPVGPKMDRFLQLVTKYPASRFSCILDDIKTASDLSALFASNNSVASIFVDVNTGMNRTGAGAVEAYRLIDHLTGLPGIQIAGIHAYDGHVKEKSLVVRQQMGDEAFDIAETCATYAREKTGLTMPIVVAGSPSFDTHLQRNVQCSPGTFVFWDWGYRLQCPEEPYEIAALVITRVISRVNDDTVTTDLGYKSVASENTPPRVHFLNAPGALHVMHNEEHLTLQVDDAHRGLLPGSVLYGVPYHVCPTIALYDHVYVAMNNEIVDEWQVTARTRKITI